MECGSANGQQAIIFCGWLNRRTPQREKEFRAVAVFVEVVTIMRGQDGGVTGRNGRRERELALGLRLVMPGKPGSPNSPLCIRIEVRMVATFKPGNRIGVAAPVSGRVHHGVSAGGQ
jgi:hypothetical protein